MASMCPIICIIINWFCLFLGHIDSINDSILSPFIKFSPLKLSDEFMVQIKMSVEKNIRLEEMTYGLKFQISREPAMCLTLGQSLHLLWPHSLSTPVKWKFDEIISKGPSKSVILCFRWKMKDWRAVWTLSERTHGFIPACLPERVHRVSRSEILTLSPWCTPVWEGSLVRLSAPGFSSQTVPTGCRTLISQLSEHLLHC